MTEDTIVAYFTVKHRKHVKIPGKKRPVHHVWDF
jgi:hypothetical protein